MNDRVYNYDEPVDENFLIQMEKHKQQELELLKLTQQKANVPGAPIAQPPHHQPPPNQHSDYMMHPPQYQKMPPSFEFTPYHQMVPNRNFSLEQQNFDIQNNNPFAYRPQHQFSPQSMPPPFPPQIPHHPPPIPQHNPQILSHHQIQHIQHQLHARKRTDNNMINSNNATTRPSVDLQPSSPFFQKYQNDTYTLDSDCALHLTKKVTDDLNILLRFIQSSESPILQTCSSHLLTAKHNISKFTTTVANINSNDNLAKLSNELSNSKLEDYTFLDILGTGTFGIARLCNYVPLNEYLCVKILNKEKVVRLKQVEHVLSEKYILSNCRHPFVVHLFKTFQDETNLYFIMEYVSGGELFSAIKKRGGLHIDAARIYAAEIILVIEYLHLNHIIHRDLKPENLLIDKTGHLKLTDFGFAKYLVDKTWTTCGTPEYIAPEIILSKGHNKGVDWWSLGILLYEMIVGQPPFQGDEEYSVFEKILNLDYSIPNYVDPIAADLISQLLVVDTTQRLGCMIGGVSDVKSHPFFDNINWNALLLKMELGPIHPRILKENDTSNFFIDNEEVYRNVSTGFSSFNDDIFKDF